MSPVVIGRATQMGALEAALEAAPQGSPATLLIGGELGSRWHHGRQPALIEPPFDLLV
jgi:hypothetical protein